MSPRVEGGRLFTRPPFHLEATVRVLQRRPTNLIDVWEDDRYRRLFATANGLTLVEVENRGTLDAPDVRYLIRGSDTSSATKLVMGQSVRKILGLDIDPAPLQQLAEIDRTLAGTALALRGMRPPRFAGLFETFASVIPFQQLSLDAGVAIVGRLVERFGKHFELSDRRYYSFPTAQTIADARLDRLRSCGLSGKKAQTLRHLARLIESGELSETEIADMSTSDALNLLTQLPGIGPWSAGVVLLRGFGRIDMFPVGDVGAARGLGALLRLGPGVLLDDVVARFGDHRGYLYFCGLGWSLLAKELIHAAPREQ